MNDVAFQQESSVRTIERRQLPETRNHIFERDSFEMVGMIVGKVDVI